eukprot:CAMPEP_0118682572 /NCGR_PEP_ID=MMETSP0800-20121206/5555_1 /TAXON_ID=210618 ORGANISM="Striatella unipunctata, Strain CCMP2910" /NCGR_SAMPLE_ID=MMETSP0800 /ASSEMBLY_ACC=CAM_ASM_000638 /LENGTH=54 /DNA_ID=CAMNT_0006578967 /DNA_START=1731 /DNA_END=1891 /DNA_ORIENTATION=+
MVDPGDTALTISPRMILGCGSDDPLDGGFVLWWLLGLQQEYHNTQKAENSTLAG